MSNLYSVAKHLLENQPNGVIIGYSNQEKCKNINNIAFHHLSRRQQIEQIIEMIQCGVDLKDLQIELYLVAHKKTQEVRREYGLF
jgi:hypothetical protein